MVWNVHKANIETEWDTLTKDQINLICKYRKDFDYKKYWNKLTHWQKELIHEYRDDFDYETYWWMY